MRRIIGIIVVVTLVLGVVLAQAAPAAACEGRTPGFWKNHAITIGAWNQTGYSTSQSLSSVFSSSSLYGLGDDTLLEALSYKGGPGLDGAARILLRSAVAALLNSAWGEIQYNYGPDCVISNTNEFLDTQNRAEMLEMAADFDYYNNQGDN